MKDHLRDYSTAAFRFYAKVGGREQYIKDLMEDIQKYKGTGVCSPTESYIVTEEKIIESRQAEFQDIDAVNKALSMLDMCNQGHYIRQAIEMVYMKDCWRDLEKGDIENRVHYAEIHIPASRAQIYRWLAKARKIFAEERGLRIQ